MKVNDTQQALYCTTNRTAIVHIIDFLLLSFVLELANIFFFLLSPLLCFLNMFAGD